MARPKTSDQGTLTAPSLTEILVALEQVLLADGEDQAPAQAKRDRCPHCQGLLPIDVCPREARHHAARDVVRRARA